MSSKVGFKFRLAAIVVNTGTLGLGTVTGKEIKAAKNFVADCLLRRKPAATRTTVTKVPNFSIDEIMYERAIEAAKSAIVKMEEYGEAGELAGKILKWNGKGGITADVDGGSLRDFALAQEMFFHIGTPPKSCQQEVLALQNFTTESRDIINILSTQAVRNDCPFKSSEEVEPCIAYIKTGVKLLKDILDKAE